MGVMGERLCILILSHKPQILTSPSMAPLAGLVAKELGRCPKRYTHGTLNTLANFYMRPYPASPGALSEVAK